jgi:hypothetical protein
MAYLVTKQRRTVLLAMREAMVAKRLARPIEYRPAPLPDLRRRIVIIDYDFGERFHTLDMPRVGNNFD